MSSLDAGGRTEMGHRKISGLRSHRGKDGRLYWITDTFVGGRPPKGHRVYESWGAVTWEEAERFHSDLVEIEWRRKRKVPPPVEEPVGMSIEDAVQRYLIALEDAGRAPATVIANQRDLNWLIRYLAKKDGIEQTLNEIGLEEAETFRFLLRRGLQPDGKTPLPRTPSFRYRKNIISAAACLFEFASKPGRKWTFSNPFHDLVDDKPPKGSTRKRDESFRKIHPRQDQELLSRVDGDWRRCAVALGLYLGVRATPAISLRLDDVNLFEETICVPSEFNKGIARGTREDLWLPVPRRVMPFLRVQYEAACRAGSPWLFPTGVVRGRKSETGHINSNKLSRIVARAAARLGFSDHPMFKSLRVICNNRLRAAGIHDAINAAAYGARGILGHASEQSARPYLDIVIEYHRKVIARYDEWLDEMECVAKNVVTVPRKVAESCSDLRAVPNGTN